MLNKCIEPKNQRIIQVPQITIDKIGLTYILTPKEIDSVYKLVLNVSVS